MSAPGVFGADIRGRANPPGDRTTSIGASTNVAVSVPVRVSQAMPLGAHLCGRHAAIEVALGLGNISGLLGTACMVGFHRDFACSGIALTTAAASATAVSATAAVGELVRNVVPRRFHPEKESAGIG